MLSRKAALGAAAFAALCSAQTHAAANDASTGGSSGIEEVVVTAQKLRENINNVGMSIQAASGDELTKLGITDTSQLVKIVPGFNYTPSYYGTPIYAIRGIGYLDTSLAGSPTVSVYQDEVPLPYSIMTTGASLDLQQVEVLKGPQGTLFGENATGGAINYIAAKPSDNWQAGADFSYGRFNTVDLQGYVGGPVTDTLSFRVAARTVQSDDWQYSYTHPAESGAQDLFEGRASFLWKPDSRFTALFTLNAFVDRSDDQMPQLYGIAVLSPASPLDPRIGIYPFNQFGNTTGFHYPFAPENARAADWSACVNASPFDPPFDATPIGVAHPITSTDCVAARRNNHFFSQTLRMDYAITDDLTLTSLTAHEHFDRYQPIEGDGTIYQDYESIQRGHIDTTYQELRLSGNLWGKGNWIFGGNYETDSTWDHFFQTYGGSTANPTAIPGSVLCFALNCTGVNLAGVPLYYETTLGPTQPVDLQHTTAYAVFGNFQYPITDDITLQAGARFTETDKKFHGCGNDGGDGTWAAVSQQIQDLLELLNGYITPAQYMKAGASPGGNGINVGPGNCATSGPAPNFNPQYFTDTFNESNGSWRAGVNWTPVEQTLIYANVSLGWKAGAFPTVATSAFTQLAPAKQEGLLAYEAGFKTTVLNDTLHVNGAVFYYDYRDKQILGAVIDPVFGPLPALVNVPKSHVIGFELSGTWEPVSGLTFSPGVSYTKSRIDGCSTAGTFCINGNYYNYDPFSQKVNLTGEGFPADPQWQADLDVQYEWQATANFSAFVGANVNYQSDANGFFYNRAPYPAGNALPPRVLDIPAHTLLDLRAGVENDTWRFQVWGRNVNNAYYWTTADHVNDVLVRYAGMPVTYGATLTYRFQ